MEQGQSAPAFNPNNLNGNGKDAVSPKIKEETQMRINNNLLAMNAHRQYGINNAKIAGSTEKLSSGYRINRAGDDAAGLAISEKMRAQIRGLTMASKNSQDAISLVQTAEGALQESHNILQRMRELAVQSASDTNETSVDRDALNKEFQQLIAELDDTASKAKFNDQGLIDGTFAKTITTAVASGGEGDLGSAWSQGVNAAGPYEITTSSQLIQSGAAAVTATGTVTQDFKMVSNATNSDISVSFHAAKTGNGIASSSINGVWKFNLSGGEATATNELTGEVIVGQLQAISGVAAGGAATANTITVSFGGLGDLKIGNKGEGSVGADSFISLSGEVKMTDGVTKTDDNYAHYATIKGGDKNETILLETGQTMLNFENSGISVKLNSAIAVDSTTYANVMGTDPTTPGAGVTASVGTVTVSKNSGRELTIQTGANQGDTMSINVDKMDAYTLGVANSNIGSKADAAIAITQVNEALNIVSTQRAALGALQNRLNHKIANLDTSAENLQAAESRIRDVDMAKEMTAFTKNNILFQASTAMLAQANAAPQGVLQLLG